MPPLVNTILGPIETSEMGFTSMHEHVGSRALFYATDHPVDCCHKVPKAEENDEIKMADLAAFRSGYYTTSTDILCLDDIDLMAAELRDFAQAGGGTVLECSAPGLRGSMDLIKQVSKATGVHIVMSSGLYVEESWPDAYKSMTTAEYRQFLLQEIQDGIEGTGVLPGQIKVAVNGKPSDQFLAFLKAVSQVAGQTNIAVTAHIEENSDDDCKALIDFALNNGLPADRLILAHSQVRVQEMSLETLVRNKGQWAPKLDFVKYALDLGVNISFDCFGASYSHEIYGDIPETDAHKIAAIVWLAEQGFADQIVIGNDVFHKIMCRRYGGHGYTRITEFVVPTLEELELEKGLIQRITHENPARLLSY